MWKEFIDGFSGSWTTTLRIIGRLVRYRPAPSPSSRSETLEEFEEPIIATSVISESDVVADNPDDVWNEDAALRREL